MHVRKDDLVEVITGDDAVKGRARKVMRVLREKGKVVVEGVNRVYKHLKARASRRNPQGGRLAKEMPIDASNVLLYCPTCKRGVRHGRKVLANGDKDRVCKKCGASLGLITTAKKKKQAAR
jgi:large subunit ribosomal protein L24